MEQDNIQSEQDNIQLEQGNTQSEQGNTQSEQDNIQLETSNTTSNKVKRLCELKNSKQKLLPLVNLCELCGKNSIKNKIKFTSPHKTV